MKIALLISLAILAWLGLRSLEGMAMYYPDRQLIATPAICRLRYEDVVLQTSDGKRVHGWFIPSGQADAPVILLCHGNAGNISHRLDKAVMLHHINLAVLLFDYRGYGQSEGVPSEQGTYADAEAAYRYLTEVKKISPGRIVLYGESLGCAVAVELARRHPAAALILESPFTSTVAMAKRLFPWLPIGWMVRNRYDNLSKIAQMKMPLLVMHSPQDEIVPFQMGQQLYAAAPNPKTFFELMGSHNDGFLESGERYTSAIRQFLKGT